MKNKHLVISALVILLAVGVSCTENTRAKHYGGKETITLSEGERLVNVTWKEGGNMWILTKKDKSTPSTVYTFKEKSSFGVLEGEVTIIEK